MIIGLPDDVRVSWANNTCRLPDIYVGEFDHVSCALSLATTIPVCVHVHVFVCSWSPA